MKLSEAGYGVIEDPVRIRAVVRMFILTQVQSQRTLFAALGVKPKLQSEVKAEAAGRD